MQRTTFEHWSMVAILIAALGLAGPIACSSGPEIEDMDHADQAEYLYRQGEQSLEDGRYVEATDRFNTVRNEYPYSRWAALANLGIADAYYEQEQYASAVQQYRGFVDLYPRHEKVEYAQWRVALSFYEQMPSDFFIMPSPHERDLSTTEDAVRALQAFMREFEDSQYYEQAQEKWREAMGRLANHEMYVAEHYMGENNFVATIHRLQYLLEHYGGHGHDAEAKYMMGEAYVQLGEADQARAVWSDLVEDYPGHPRADEAAERLQSL